MIQEQQYCSSLFSCTTVVLRPALSERWELLKLNKEGRLVLSADTLAVIAKISNPDLEIRTVSGCIVNRRQAKEILEDTDP